MVPAVEEVAQEIAQNAHARTQKDVCLDEVNLDDNLLLEFLVNGRSPPRTVDADNDANANADDGNDANASEADLDEKAKDDPFPVLTCKERCRFIDIQRIIIQTLIT